jgi:hypothetical protein
MIAKFDTDAEWRDCEWCLSFDTGPVLTRQSDYVPGEGHAVDPGVWPFARVVQLDDGWLAVWDAGAKDERRPPYLICPHHARDEQVPRPDEFVKVGDVEVDLREFDYIGTRPPNIVMFKHVATKRYLNLADRNGRGVWCDYQTDLVVVERDVAAGFRYARSS